jgi:AcrR family transcriptional regulator
MCAMPQNTAQGRPLRKDAARNRQRILDAAYELFAARGLSVTLNDIAHYAGVGVGTVYRHFPDREQLIDGLFEQRIDEVAALLQEAVEDPDPWHGLTHFLEGNLALQAQDRGLRELILGAAGGFERLARARARLYPIGAQLIARAHDAGALRADIEPQDLPLIQLMLSSVIDVGQDVAPDLWRRYLAIVLRGLRADAGTPEQLPAAPPPPERVDKMMAAAWGPRR